jgi:hypothetical protein
MVYKDVIERIGMAIEAAGVAVIVIRAVMAFVAAAERLSRRESESIAVFASSLA